MPATRVIAPKPVEKTTKLAEMKTKSIKTKPAIQPETRLKVPTARKPRASSCPRRVHSDRCETTKTQNTVSTTRCERRARSTSVARKPTGIYAKETPTCQKTISCSKQVDVTAKSADATATTRQDPQSDRPKMHYAIHSHKPFTVIPPNPKKRKEIQRKAEAELAALEDLKLSRAMAYVSISPSSVGGCMSLEEVRLKQQREMQASRRQRQVKKYLTMESTPVLTI